jgi:hypothetical protein
VLKADKLAKLNAEVAALNLDESVYTTDSWQDFIDAVDEMKADINSLDTIEKIINYTVDISPAKELLVLTISLLPDFDIDNEGILREYTGDGTDVVIPDGVTGIIGLAFESCYSLESVTIPSSVRIIEYSAFEDCTSLTSINVDANNEYYSSVDGVLFNKDQATLVLCPEGRAGDYTIPASVTAVGDHAFRYCTSLTSISIPDCVNYIGEYAFYYCESLESIRIPDGVEVINARAFYGCFSLKSINIPDGVTSIGHNAFLDCSSLESIIIPDGVKSIGNYAFSGCSSLESIIIPDSVTSFGVSVFQECPNLTVYGSFASAAHAYVIENKIPFSAVDLTNVMGDINNDNVVGAKDVLRLRRFLARDWPSPDNMINAGVADCNGDGEVDAKDVLRLRRFLAEDWPSPDDRLGE